MKTVPIDNGYHDTKFIINNQLQKIRSRYTEDNEGDFEHLGRKYALGHGFYNIDHHKTDNELHKLMTYYILSKATDFISEEFRLVLSLPMLHYKAQKDSFKDYIQGNGPITTWLSGERKTFSIKDIVVFLQGAGALYAANPMQYKGKLIGLLDIGGLTAQGAIFEDLKPIPDTMFTIDAGGIILNNKIKTTLNERYGLNIQDYEIPYLEGYTDEIEDIKRKHFNAILLEMKKKNWSIETLPILITGGGSISMTADKYLPRGMMTNDPIFDHVKGLQRVGMVIFR